MEPVAATLRAWSSWLAETSGAVTFGDVAGYAADCLLDGHVPTAPGDRHRRRGLGANLEAVAGVCTNAADLIGELEAEVRHLRHAVAVRDELFAKTAGPLSTTTRDHAPLEVIDPKGRI